MARVTVEDCLKHVDNRFELVLVATKRARRLMKEALDPLIPWDNDKPPVVALREIADDLLTKEGEPKELATQHTETESANTADAVPPPVEKEEEIEEMPNENED